MTRQEVDKAIYDYVAANGLDPTDYDYTEFNQLLDDVDGNAPYTEFENEEMTDTEFELYQMAKKWFYDENHGYPEDIISGLYDLLVSVNNAAEQGK